ncbi:hypothetical protein GUITHDRAFT_158911 [Guillardia theta CCMP2712]|uniref:FAD dependent oxidoreductase domain-containing protein n=2 Tax=Guillardia theta TaxID=55529 RepID=L1IC24_GUITC|nr:hypothetical protein GUITHDRAFT_158911 [Guillardia theta CCMP2712]EKX33390.1 hypothetical protein GUITHDRAFT_158911 [Guillardia theta CCMP2712]|eukprot:XP_005820370.1 hypothetical protein GUITHDRAFT_158911 [Guillardia theta CCMP2712]
MSEPKVPKNVVICGGGIQSAAIAYYLSLRGVAPTVIERSEIACAASGKAGGFLARGWGNGDTAELHEVSFDLHEQLSKDLKLKGYRKLPTLSVAAGSRSKTVEAAVSSGKAPSWLDKNVAKASLMDDETAQTNPFELTTALMDFAVSKGAKVVKGKVDGIEMEGDEVKAVRVGDKAIETDCCVIAMGPWSCMAEDWFPGLSLPMQGVRSTSIVYKSEENVDAFALFCAEDSNGCHLEVYPRASNEIYLCGIGGSKYLDNDDLKKVSPEEITADPSRVAAAERSFGSMSSLGSKKADIAQACMRPCPPDAKPYLGRIPGTQNAFIAAGHNCWGILWAPVTGLAMSELILDGKSKCVDLSPFNPGRFSKKSAASSLRRGRQQVNEPVGEQW